jgi:hemerythrin-like domain-containing protein
MLRDKNLVPLSRQHQHALALCVRLDRALEAGEVDTDAWQTEIAQQFELEVRFHFAAEEKEVFPRAAHFPELRDLVQELLAEHETLRSLFARALAHDLDPLGLAEIAEKLATHIRKEERQLFEAIQGRIDPEEMREMGAELERALAEAATVCAVPRPAEGG